MARIRSVHPDLHRDKTLALASASAERTFVRLWCHLDDEGRGEDDLDLLKADLYPRHKCMGAGEIDADLSELEALGLVIRYEADGVRLIACKPSTWLRYQKPQKKQESRLPPPPDKPTTPPLQDQSDTPTGTVPPVVGGEQEGSTPTAASADADNVHELRPSYTKRRADELRAEGVDLPKSRTLAYRAVLEHDYHRAEPKERHGKAIAVIADYVAVITGEPLATDGRTHLAWLINAHDALTVFDVIAESVRWGAGIGEKFVGDEKALTKYATAILTKRAAS